MTIPILHIDYTEPDPSTYQGARVQVGEDSFTIHGCCPAHDYQVVSIIAFLIAGTVMCSSDVDNFVMDGGILIKEEYSKRVKEMYP